jgi:hypothetical protein
MTPRSFFIILIKMMGIYMVLESITVIPGLFTSIYMFRNPAGENDTLGIILTFSMLLLVTALFFVTLRYCLFKTDWLIDKLSLDKHFKEEKFDLNIHRSTVLRISVIVIAGLMFVESLPSLCRQVYLYIQQQSFESFGDHPSRGWLIFETAKVFIAYFLITNSRLVVNFIERQRKK